MLAFRILTVTQQVWLTTSIKQNKYLVALTTVFSVGNYCTN